MFVDSVRNVTVAVDLHTVKNLAAKFCKMLLVVCQEQFTHIHLKIIGFILLGSSSLGASKHGSKLHYCMQVT